MGTRSMAKPVGRPAFTRANREIKDAPQPVRRPPLMRIERTVKLDTVHQEEWRDYVEKFTRVNRHLPVKNLGNMACTFIEANELGAMLAERYPARYTDMRDIKTLHREFANRFSVFIKNSSRASREAEQDMFLEERFFREPDSAPLEVPDNLLHDQWAIGAFAVRGHLRVAGTHSLVLDLTGNETLWQEMEAVRDYLKFDEKLNIKKLNDLERRPHITLLRVPDSNIREVGVQLMDHFMPPEITLQAPTAWAEPIPDRVPEAL